MRKSSKKNQAIFLKVDGRPASAHLGANLLQVVTEVGMFVSAPCGGRGSCGKCRVVVNAGSEHLSKVDDLETLAISNEEFAKGYRLGCLARLTSGGGVTISVPPESRFEPQKLLTGGLMPSVRVETPLSKCFVRITKPTIESISSDADCLVRVVKASTGLTRLAVSHEALLVLPDVLREANWQVTVALRGEEIIWVEEGDTTSRKFGFALDIGTTKLAGYLVDLNTGKTLAISSRINPQSSFGADVISRVSYASEDRAHLGKLQQVVLGGAMELVGDICRKAGLKKSEIYEITVVGNTIMNHIFLGLNPRWISSAPYPAVLRDSCDVKADRLGILVNPGAYVHVLPNLAGNVGADVIADVIATRMHRSKELTLLLDIGTNSQIVMGNRQRIAAVSAPSGPAFEGGEIKDGMKAEIGAIERVWIDPTTLEPGYKVIGNRKPRGICGSGIIDALAHMYKCEIIGPDGRWNQGVSGERLRKNKGVFEYVLTQAPETTTNKDIVVRHSDVRAIQLAKATVASGIEVLFRYLGLKESQIERVYLAGAFGTYVDPQSARMIGMYPTFPLSQVQFIGNAAGVGARLALISSEMREQADTLSTFIQFVPLSIYPDFQKYFLKNINFPEKEISMRNPETSIYADGEREQSGEHGESREDESD